MLKDLLVGLPSAEPVGSSPTLDSLLRPAAIRVAGMSLPRAMNALAKGAVAAPHDADLASNTVTFEPQAPAERPEARRRAADDAREMAQRLGARRRALEMSGTPNVRRWARLSAYEQHLKGE